MEKNENMEHYEMLYIIPNKFTEEEAGEIASKNQKEITDRGGKVIYTENWGKKRLAYPIDGNNHGYYNLIEFDLERSKLAELNEVFKMSNEVIRHLIIKKQVKTEEALAKEKEISEKIAAKNIEAKEEEARAAAEEKKEKREKDEKVDIKDLDEKLDNILDTDDLL